MHPASTVSSQKSKKDSSQQKAHWYTMNGHVISSTSGKGWRFTSQRNPYESYERDFYKSKKTNYHMTCWYPDTPAKTVGSVEVESRFHLPAAVSTPSEVSQHLGSGVPAQIGRGLEGHGQGVVEHGEVLQRRMGGHFGCKRGGNAMNTTHINTICIWYVYLWWIVDI